jgi:hypothetical protein
MRKNLFALILAIGLLLPTLAIGQTAVKITPQEKKIAEGITADQLKDYLYFVASDEMEGRDTPSRGLDTTAKFIATLLDRWGFKPAGDDGTYFQKIALHSESVDPSATTLKVGDQAYTMNEDFFRLAGNTAANGQMVFAGNGWVIKPKNIDPYQGVDVRGKIIVLYSEGFPGQGGLTRTPNGLTRADLQGLKRGTDYFDPATYARTNGAAGIILIASPQAEGAWSDLKQYFSRGSMYPEKLLEGPATNTQNATPVFYVSSKVGDAILAGESGNKTSATAFAINKNVSMATASKSDTKWTQNVVAIWEGRDPVLKNEMVAIGAHYDHVGMNPLAPGPDKIWNGADDDGSGTVSVLSIAEALSKAPVRPKRSVLFVWHCGEEKGLWGSAYFNKFPTVDIKNVIAQLNIDMIGRSRKTDDTNPKNKELSGENEIYVIGKDMMSSTLGSIVDATNKGYLNLNYDTRYDDPKDPNRFFFRSDHFNYAHNGIPITFWFDGVHEDYHQPGDEPQKIDYIKMEKVARTIFLTLWELTDAKTRPAVDKQLPKELTER